MIFNIDDIIYEELGSYYCDIDDIENIINPNENNIKFISSSNYVIQKFTLKNTNKFKNYLFDFTEIIIDTLIVNNLSNIIFNKKLISIKLSCIEDIYINFSDKNDYIPNYLFIQIFKDITIEFDKLLKSRRLSINGTRTENENDKINILLKNLPDSLDDLQIYNLNLLNKEKLKLPNINELDLYSIDINYFENILDLDSLKILRIHKNNLKELPYIPKNIELLEIKDNPLKYLPILKDNMDLIYII